MLFVNSTRYVLIVLIEAMIYIVRHVSNFCPGVTSEGPAARHLLPRVALAGPSESPRAEGSRLLRVSVLGQAEGGLHQPLPLSARREPWYDPCPSHLPTPP